MNYMRMVKRRLEERRVPVFVAQTQVGQSFAELTRIGLARAKGMVAFCTTAPILVLVRKPSMHWNMHTTTRLCEEWAPAPQNNPRGTFQNEFVFKNGLVYVDDRQMNNAEGAADQIADSVTSSGIFAN